ncbi:unnamed protein product [Fraxinus pennsylvanica]|uniref:Oil body-associated protein 2A n=1 Tax=Fraxinus pennsylvanica TaxID=56036 RepID=A0AAD2A9R2_9LAMI|nr:unnamed protein product [Fraxinus pennsylvanica]
MATINGTGAQAGEQIPPGKPMSMEQHMLDKGAQMLQSLMPIKHMNQHVCTFALYSHDMTRQIETHHYVTRVNQDFLQCAVYDTDDSTGHLIGVEYIVSDRIFETLPPDEQKLWHTHAYEIKSSLWVNPRVPEMVVRPELENLAKTYGKFWCTWQTDRGDKLPMGPPALMMSPQGAGIGVVNPVLVQKRDNKYNISSDALKSARVEIAEPEWLNPQADYWKQHHDKGDKLPMGPPALMMSPQGAGIGVVNPVLVQKRDDKYNISSDALKSARVEIAEPEWLNPQADYWKQHHDKGFAVEVETTEMKKRASFP